MTQKYVKSRLMINVYYNEILFQADKPNTSPYVGAYVLIVQKKKKIKKSCRTERQRRTHFMYLQSHARVKRTGLKGQGRHGQYKSV